VGLLKRGPKIGIEEFCQQFYDSKVFDAVSTDKDFGSVLVDNVFELVAEADQSFAGVDKDMLRREMTALRIELFGLAFMHHVKKDKHLLAQAIFTKSYLGQNGQLEIWSMMLEYNQAIAASSTEIVTGLRMKRGWTAGMNYLRLQLFEEWTKAGFDPECVARVSNRVGTEVAWEKGITIERLTGRLLERLGYAKLLESEALIRLETTILGLYESARKSIQSVTLQSK
jgi:hypothetical protein